MARPVSTKATYKVRLSKSVMSDVESVRWGLKMETNDLIEAAIIEYLATHAKK